MRVCYYELTTQRIAFIDHVITTFTDAIATTKAHLPISVGFLVVLFVIHILNWVLRFRLNVLGIWPRKPWGLIGIPFSPFLHGNIAHLLFNSFPLFVFSNFILLQGTSIFYEATAAIIVIAGLLIWLLGRPGVHVGASALIMGYLGFIGVHIYQNPNALSIVIGFVCLYYFGGLLLSVLPSQDKQISWEGHLFGAIAGIMTALWMTSY